MACILPDYCYVLIRGDSASVDMFYIWDPEWTELQVAKHRVHCYPIRVSLKVYSIFGVAKLRHL